MRTFTYFCNCPHKDGSLLHTETIRLFALTLSWRIDAVISSGNGGVRQLFPLPSSHSKMVASSPLLTPELCRPVLCSCHSGFSRLKRWKWHQRDVWVCAHTHTHTHTHAIDCFGMHSPRVNRVTSSASCSVLKLSTPEPCATYQDIYMILGVLCQRPQLILKPWHLFALPVAMRMAWRWFSGKVKEGTASSGTDDDCTEARITKLAYLRHGLD